VVDELAALVSVFVRLSLAAFGGAVGVVPQMQREAVARGWVTDRQFVDIFALGQITPGPGILITVVFGERAAGPLGALVAGLSMFLPTSLITWLVAERWSRLGDAVALRAVRAGMAPVALGLIASGGYVIGRTALDSAATYLIALIMTVALVRFRANPGLMVLLAGVAGWLLFR
jgi:chromate transporter